MQELIFKEEIIKINFKIKLKIQDPKKLNLKTEIIIFEADFTILKVKVLKNASTEKFSRKKSQKLN